MLRYLLHRPVAVSVTFITLAGLSILAFLRLPVSLLPEQDVPLITISVNYPNSPPLEIEQNILKPIRETMLSVNGLRHAESTAYTETGVVHLRFEHGTNMQLAYIEVNEKIDRLTPLLPRNLERPLVMRAGLSDIPVIRIQVVPSDPSDLPAVSELAVFTLKKRLEQLEGTGLVDLNGLQNEVITITPRQEILHSLGLTEEALTQVIRQANLQPASVSVRDGNYRYLLRISSPLYNADHLRQLPVQLPDTTITLPLSTLATVGLTTATPQGFHLYNGRESIVMAVHKQAQARMTNLMPRIEQAVEQFRKDYPQLRFFTSQDQSELLTLSIDNLTQALVFGGLFAFAVLFAFMGNWREPLIMGVVLPVSLLLSFAVLYLFNISLNIVSLSGLALGLGMLVDNSIVVVDQISLNRKNGMALTDACVKGTTEVIIPLVSSAMTNLAVFVPLIFMSGITGALFYDQALSVFAILSVSLACTFILVPLIYRQLYGNEAYPAQQDSRFFLVLHSLYSRSFSWIWRYRKPALIVMCCLIPLTVTMLFLLPKTGFPEIERTEALIEIDWNVPVDAHQNKARTTELLEILANKPVQSEAEVGHRQFIVDKEVYTTRQTLLYLKYANSRTRAEGLDEIKQVFKQRFPESRITISDAPNAFEQLFISRQPEYEVRFRMPQSSQLIPDSLKIILLEQASARWDITLGKGFETETGVVLVPDIIKLKQYNLSFEKVTEALQMKLSSYRITDLTDYGKLTRVVLTGKQDDFATVIRNTLVRSENGMLYPVSEFLQVKYMLMPKAVTADASGMYQSLEPAVTDEPEIRKFFNRLSTSLGLMADFTGKWFDDRQALQRLVLILMVSVMLVYFILTAEFESFRQPVLVMMSLPLGFAGSLLLLWLSGGTLNIMSGIGLVVVLGILDNDAILKIDRINRLRENLPLEQAIKQAGHDRLKAIVMNTCTNVLAVTPLVFSSGLGADLQRPVAITTIGGLIAATFTALYFVPLLYYAFIKRS
ncbi:MAG: efflux RND transporter permease subunit [Cyclobacteriaceae bacterium]|nr:efflux RND transporter permease subunit [Cyclobacteriaceae bacterium]MDW8331190.1 efflux RND transporter permease subunit [Cyclobacteriaceae bacterium]